MSQCIIFTNAAGGLSIIHPTGETDIQHIIDNDIPSGVQYEIVDSADIPSDRTLRDAWVHDTSPSPVKVSVDLVKAKAKAHDQRRAHRYVLFKPLDRMATVPSMAAKAEADRQAIRDADALKQSAIDAATDEASLIAAMSIVV